jgi:hypothetical protein
VPALLPSKKNAVRAEDLTLMGRLSPADFHAIYGFRHPDMMLFEISR